jgi:hypothetical protein
MDKKKQDISPKICKSCHNEFPPLGGNQRLCLDCKQKKLKQELKKTKKKSPYKVPVKAIKEPLPCTSTGDDPLPTVTVMLDFTEYPEVLKKISEQARANFRPVSMHILYLLHGGIDINEVVMKLNEKEE